jgi:hypothetical protein
MLIVPDPSFVNAIAEPPDVREIWKVSAVLLTTKYTVSIENPVVVTIVLNITLSLFTKPCATAVTVSPAS